MQGKRPIRIRALLALCVTAMAGAAPSVASADGPGLVVSNLGQESAPVEVGQPPIAVSATNSCEHPFTFANEAACAPGAWPPLGAPWGQIERVAGGDTLRLDFSGPVSSVSVGSTSNYEPGLRDPDGNPVGNYDVVAESGASATSDPRVWLFTLPQLDVRAIGSAGYTFSVAAQDGAGFHGYPFGIRSPRYADEAKRCGQAWYSTGFGQYLCLSAAPAKTPAPARAHRKRKRCKKGFRKKRVRGKVRCVKVKKPR